MPRMVVAASSVAAPALSSTVALRKSTKRTSDEQRPQQLADARGTLDHDVGRLLELGRPLVRAHADADRHTQAAQLDELAEAAEGVEVGDVVAHVERGRQLRVTQQGDDPRALV